MTRRRLIRSAACAAVAFIIPSKLLAHCELKPKFTNLEEARRYIIDHLRRSPNVRDRSISFLEIEESHLEYCKLHNIPCEAGYLLWVRGWMVTQIDRHSYFSDVDFHDIGPDFSALIHEAIAHINCSFADTDERHKAWATELRSQSSGIPS